MQRSTWSLSLLIALSLVGCSSDKHPKTTGTPPDQVQHTTAKMDNASLSPDGHYAIVASLHQPAKLWDLQNNLPLYSWQNSRENKTGIIATGFSPDGKYASTAESGNLALWDVTTGKVLSYWLMHDTIRDLAVSQDGNYVLVGLGSNRAEYVEMETGLSVRIFEHKAPVNSVALSDDGRYAATGSDDKIAGLWDVQTGQPLQAWKFEEPVTKVLISAKSHYVFAATQSGKVTLFDRKTGKKIKSTPPSTGVVSAAAFAPSEKYLVIHNLPEKMTVWDIEHAKVLKVFSHSAAVLAVGFSPKENRILTEDAQGQGHQWALDKEDKSK